MIIINLKRVVRAGFVNFWRNPFVSFSAILQMTLALFVISSVIFLSSILNFTLLQIKDKVDVNVYFTPSAEESDILSIKKSLEGLPEVSKVNYISREQALVEFKQRHSEEQLVLQALNELSDNPLGASISIKAKDPSQYEGIANFLRSNETHSKDGSVIVDKVNYYENKVAIDRLTQAIDLINSVGLGMSIFFVLISIIVTMNTIGLVIHVAREEISIMRLVGASSRYVKGPFVVSGLIYGVISTIIVVILLFPITYWMSGITGRFFTGLNLFSFYVSASNFLQIFGTLLISGLFIGTLSSLIAIRRYLKH